MPLGRPELTKQGSPTHWPLTERSVDIGVQMSPIHGLSRPPVNSRTRSPRLIETVASVQKLSCSYLTGDVESGIGNASNLPPGKMGLGHPPEEESNPLRLNIIFTRRYPHGTLSSRSIILTEHYLHGALFMEHYCRLTGSLAGPAARRTPVTTWVAGTPAIQFASWLYS